MAAEVLWSTDLVVASGFRSTSSKQIVRLPYLTGTFGSTLFNLDNLLFHQGPPSTMVSGRFSSRLRPNLSETYREHSLKTLREKLYSIYTTPAPSYIWYVIHPHISHSATGKQK